MPLQRVCLRIGFLSRALSTPGFIGMRTRRRGSSAVFAHVMV